MTEPQKNPCFVLCDDCQRYECHKAEKCLFDYSEKKVWNKQHSPITSAEKVLDDFDTIVILKKKYRNEPAVIDALELVEDELLALKRGLEQG